VLDQSAIRTKEYESWLMENGIEFGEQADCAGVMMRIACDKSINGPSNPIIDPRICGGRTCMLPSLGSDQVDIFLFVYYSLTTPTTGRSLMITPRSVTAQGFMDVDQEDYHGSAEEYFINNQVSQLRVIKDKWLDGYKVRVCRTLNLKSANCQQPQGRGSTAGA
jgi:hypothetical protein